MKKVLAGFLLLSGCTFLRVDNVHLLKASPVTRCHGQDILGLARQDSGMISSHWDSGECLGVLQNTFGDALPAVKQIVESSTVPAVRWHLSFCNHGNQCGIGECRPDDLHCMQVSAKRINQFHSSHPNTQCYISPRLEYAEKDCSKVSKWFRGVLHTAPLCIGVASPLPGACIPRGILLERHGNNPVYGDVVSNDGDNYFDSDSVKYNKAGKVLNLKWTPRDNLRLSSEKGVALPPLQRPLTNRLGVQDLVQMQLMKNDLPPMPVPVFCPHFRALTGGEIWKNHAEDYGAKNDARGNKPLLIYSRRVNNFPIYNTQGVKISCLKYYGTYGKLFRHYVGSCSGDHAVDLYKKSGEWIFAKDGNTCIGLPSIRRWGSFR